MTRPCAYKASWGCTADAGFDGFCLPHGVLFLWLSDGEGEQAWRFAEHDAIAAQPVPVLTQTLRNETWDPRIRAVLLGTRP